MRRTYKSKKDTGGALDPRDVILTMDSKSSVFDAFYINNIKQTKRELSVVPSVPFSASNRVRKRKYVKRLKEQEPVIREPSSTSAFLTPDKSIHVNKGSDPFDLLLNSTTNRSLVEPRKSISSKNKQQGRTYCKLKSLKKKKINYSSGDSSGSDKENTNSSSESNLTQNTSDVLSHKLLIEREYEKCPAHDDSIANIVKNLSLFKESKDKISTSPRGVSSKHRNSYLLETTQNSPLCSTPFVDKYRGKSIYKFSPISINLNDSPNSLNVSKDNYEKDDRSVIMVNNDMVKSEILEQSRRKEEVEKRLDNLSYTENKRETFDNIKDTSCYVQSPILPQRTTNDTSKVKSILSHTIPGQVSSLQTSELEPFLGFSNSKVPKIDLDAIFNKYNKLEKGNSVINLSTEELENNSSSSVNSIITQNVNDIDNKSKKDSTADNTKTSLESDENVSLYDTCNSEDFDDEDATKQPIVVIERLNDSIFKKYYDRMPDFSGSSNETDTSLSDDPSSDEFASLDDKTSNTTLSSKHDSISQDISIENESVHDNSSQEYIDNQSDNSISLYNKSDDNIYTSFVTTRRRNEVTKDSFILGLDNSITSGSSADIDNTVLNKDSLIIESVDENNEVTLVGINMPTETNESKNISNIENSEVDIEKCAEVLIPSPNTRNSFISVRNSINQPSFKPQKISKSPTQRTSTIAQKTNMKINSDVLEHKIMTRKSSRLQRESIDARKSLLNPETSKYNTGLRDPSLNNTMCDIKQGIVLQPGKRWERSLSIYRRMTTMADHFDQSILDEEPLNTKGRKYRQSVISTMEMQDLKGSLHNESINSRRSTFVSKPSRSTIRIVRDSVPSRSSLCSTSVFEESQGFLTEDCDDTIVELSKLSIADSEHEVTVLEKFHDTTSRFPTARDYVLRRCNQTDIILFDECYPDTVLKNCRKIGEGVYGEVFLWRAGDGRARVLKIIPIAGNIKVNGENQKDYNEVISEIVIAMELSALRAPIADIEKHFDEGQSVETLDLHSVENATDVFNEVLAVRCVYGSYPSRLLDLWDLYDECKGSENDNPAILPVDQQYIVLELANAGQDLESYQFNNAEQAYALFKQVAFGLAVAEEAYQFEHRDLHWGNVLISPTDQKYATFVIRGRLYRVARRGVAAALIDYSLSRASLRLPAGDAQLYNDLAADDGLFDAVGDYQFEVYRLMREKLGNDWKNFEPYTNILWLHYTVDKMITALRYTRTNTKIHKHYIAKLKEIKNRILDYGSAVQYVLTDNEL